MSETKPGQNLLTVPLDPCEALLRAMPPGLLGEINALILANMDVRQRLARVQDVALLDVVSRFLPQDDTGESRQDCLRSVLSVYGRFGWDIDHWYASDRGENARDYEFRVPD